jgi:hypothetical protein
MSEHVLIEAPGDSGRWHHVTATPSFRSNRRRTCHVTTSARNVPELHSDPTPAEIGRRIFAAHAPERVYVFGSLARGEGESGGRRVARTGGVACVHA